MKKTSGKHRVASRGSDLAFIACNYTLLALTFIITLYPLIFVLSASFSEPGAVYTGKMILFPVNPTLAGYEYIFRYREIWTGYVNTIFYTVAGTFLNLAFTLPCAYALSRKDMPGRGLIMTLFIITMYFSGGLIPGYLNLYSFGLINTRWVMLISGLVSVFNLIVARTFFATSIPWELHEAARMDGCSDFKMFTRIVLPLSKPIIVVLMLYYGIGHWNSYFNAMILLKDRSLFPLQLFLREILIQGSFAVTAAAEGNADAEAIAALVKQQDTANLIKYGVIVVSTVPMLIVYPRLQSYFAKGVMIGSVKG